jgi:hypothetical protein
MKPFASLAAAAVAAVVAAPIANSQALVARPYQAVIVQPGVTVIRETPLFAVPAGQPVEIISTVETVRTVRPARTVAHYHSAHKYQDRLAADYHRPLYNTAAPPTAVAPPVLRAVATSISGSGLSGQFQCVQGCAGGLPGLAFVTQNGWELNVVNEIGQPSRAWIDYPGHIWLQSWNEGAVYSADGMTIQFDNGAVWAKTVLLVVPR